MRTVFNTAAVLVAAVVLVTANTASAQTARRASAKQAPPPLAIPDSAPDGLYAGTVKREYDRFRDSSVTYAFVRVEQVKSPFGEVQAVTMAASFVLAGEMSAVPNTVQLLFTTRTKEWQYLKCRALAFLLDGKPFALPVAKYDGQVRTGGVTESFTMSLPVAQFLRIATASSFEGKVCADEFTLTSGDLMTFRELASRMKPVKP